MQCARVVVTAINGRWLDAAVAEFSGYGSSIIGCDAEVGLERLVGESETLDGRPGAALLICLLYTSPSPRDGLLSRMPSSA